MIKKIKEFLKLDVRAKLEKLSSNYNLPLYPNKIAQSGIKRFYHKIIFYLYFRSFSKDQFKFKYDIIFNRKIEFNKIKLIMSFPRSGGTFLKSILSSYFEIANKTGDGIPKFLYDADRFEFSKKFLEIPTDFFSFARDPIEDIYFQNKLFKFDYNIPIIAFNNNIFTGLNDKQAYLVRNPIEACISYLEYILLTYAHMKEKKIEFDKEIIDKRLNYIVNEYKNYIKIIQEDKKKREIIIIKFEDLNKETFKTCEKILNYFQINIDVEVLKRSIEINTKENFIKRIPNKKSNRFSKNIFDEKLKKYLLVQLSKKLESEINVFNKI